MKTRTSPVVLGFIWGMFSMLLTFAVVSIFASLQVIFVGFPLFAYDGETQYLLIGAVFLLSVLGAIGSGLVPRLPKLGGSFILLSCVGVSALLFAPVLMQSFSFAPLEAYGIKVTPFALLIVDFTLVLFAAMGFAGGLLAFIPKKDHKLPKDHKLTLPVDSVTSSESIRHQLSTETVPSPTSDLPPDLVQARPPMLDIELLNME